MVPLLLKKLENNFTNKNSLRFFREFYVLFCLPLIGVAQWNPSNPTIPAPGDCVSAYRICDATQTYNFELIDAGVIDDANGSLNIPGMNKTQPTQMESKSGFIIFTAQYSGQFGLNICPESYEDLSFILLQNPDCTALQTGNYSLTSQVGVPIDTPQACTGLGVDPFNGGEGTNGYYPFYINLVAGSTYIIFVSVEWYTQPGTHKFTLSFQGQVVLDHPDVFNHPECTMSAEDQVKNEDYVLVYPNPFSDSFTISSPLSFEKIELYDVTGKRIFEQEFKTTIKLVNVSQGIYFLHLIDNEGKKMVKKLVKE